MVQSLLNTFERDLIAMGEDSEKQPVQDLEAKMEQQNKKKWKKIESLLAESTIRVKLCDDKLKTANDTKLRI